MPALPFHHAIDRSLVNTNGGPPPLLLLLHGSGDNEHGLLDVGRSLAPACGGALIVSLRAPLPRFGGFCWFEGTSAAPAPDAQRSIGDATDKLLQLLCDAPSTFGTDPSRAFLFAHSQGATVGWALTLSSWPRADLLRGAVLHAGRLFPELVQPHSPLGQRVATKEALSARQPFCAHGQADQTTPVAHARQNRRYCEQLDVPHTYHEHGGGHNEIGAVLSQASAYLRELSAPSAADCASASASPHVGVTQRPSHGSVTFAAGDGVRLQLLRSQPHLNGRYARVLGKDEPSGRYMIKLGDGGPSIKVRPECIVHTIDEEGEEGYEHMY